MTQEYVRIVNGKHRNIEVKDTVFPVVRKFKAGARTNFVTVDGTHMFGRSPVRINVDSFRDFCYVTEAEYNEAVAAAESVTVSTKVETSENDEAVMKRIADRFDILHDMSKAACAGNIRAMIVTGPPGIGKSFGVEAVLEQHCLFDMVAGRKLKAEVVKGAATPIGLYKLLYDHSDENNVLVFDDADQIFFDTTSLNLLKSALDTSPKRKISWLAESNALRREDIPSSFYFKGSVIFITNLSFSNIRSKSLKEHLEALESRCHIIDLTINTTREKMLRIKQIVASGDLFKDFDLAQHQQDEIVDFLFESKDRLREISLRTAIKLAGLFKSFPDRWKSVANITLMKTTD